MPFENYLRLLCSTLLFPLVFMKSPLFSPSTVFQKPIPYISVPRHSVPLLVLVFSHPLSKTTFFFCLPVRSSNQVTNIIPKEPLNLPIPSVALGRLYQGNLTLHPQNTLIFSTSSPNRPLPYRRFVRYRFRSDLVIFTSRSDFI